MNSNIEFEWRIWQG